MPTSTYIALANITLTGNDSSVEFASIPATYRDLVLVVQNTSTVASQMSMRFNSDTGSNYNRVAMWGTGSTTGSNSSTNAAEINTQAEGQADSASAFTHINIMDYSATDKHKTGLIRFASSPNGPAVVAQAFRWASTSAITTITLAGATFTSGSTFALYGIVS